jgi:hypothetical protein
MEVVYKITEIVWMVVTALSGVIWLFDRLKKKSK